MRSAEHAPVNSRYEAALTDIHSEQHLTAPDKEMLPLTPEVRAELDASFYAIVGDLDSTVSQAERERAAKADNGKIDGSYEPPLKKPQS